MNANTTMIPSVQVGAGIPLQSTSFPMQTPQMTIPQAQTIQQSNMAPVTSGSVMQVPPGTLVPVKVGNSVVMVPTQPVATQNVLHMSVQQPIQYKTESVKVEVPAPVETEFVPTDPNVVPAPHYPQTTTPMLKTLTPRVLRNELPPKYKQVTLPAKVVTTRLPPIGPPPTPAELDIPLPAPTLPEPEPQPQVQSVLVQQPVTYQVPVQTVQTVMVPTYQTTSLMIPNYQTASVPVQTTQLAAPKFGTTSVVAQF